MRKKRTDLAPADGRTLDAPRPPTPRLNLSRMEDVRREAARVYRDMRSGRIDTQDGTRLVYVLGEIRKLFEAIEFEKRIAALEARNEL